MRSPLECISGRFEHAIFATYSVNLHFFEEWVMPLLRAAEVRNVIVFVDEAQLGLAFADRSLRSVGRSYHAASVRLGPGAFHPKLLLLSGGESVRACVSSANLTVDGQLRNVETAFVLDSTRISHTAALRDAAEFVRRVSVAQAPSHTAEAVMAALASLEDLPVGEASSPVRLVHNLDDPLIDHFPRADLTAVAPYADAGEAARALAARGRLSIITDGATFAAPSSFFEGAWSVAALDFGQRRLHGKAYQATSQEKGWLLVGSPNLSRQGLLATAATGNTELAVLLQPPDAALSDPPGLPWEREALEDMAPKRHTVELVAERLETDEGSFNAWEDDGAIVVAHLTPGSVLEYWQGGVWNELGRLDADRLVPPPEVRPYLIRAVAPSGRVRQAIVHRSDTLRIQRLRQRSTSRTADVVAKLPLDLAGVQALESVLRDLYLLGSLAGEGEERPRVGERVAAREAEVERAGLTEWMPAKPEDEPRIPDLYRRTWQNAPDALLALIRGALRLDDVDERTDERDLLEESLDVDAGEEDVEAGPEPTSEPPPPSVEAAVVRRYRNSLVRLLRRGAEYVLGVGEPALADLGFQAVLRLHEKLAELVVEVEGDLESIVEPEELLHQKLALLEAYLRKRNGRDPQCLATARVHLSDCLADKSSWTPLEWEQLEALAHRTAAMILAATEYAARAAKDAGQQLEDVTARLQPYADRSAWEGFFVEADRHLDNSDFDLEPFPWVAGEDWFDETSPSVAWPIIAYGAVVGFDERRPYGVLARNERTEAAYSSLALICDPSTQRLYEAVKRRRDGHWMVRTYSPVGAGSVDRIRALGVEALLHAGCTRTPFADLEPDAESLVAALLAVAGHEMRARSL